VLLLQATLSADAPAPSSLPNPILLPGHGEFVFTMYNCPGDLKSLKELVDVMQTEGLGNGFDPGPPSYAQAAEAFDYIATLGWPVVAYPAAPDMQVVDGTNILKDEDEAMLQRFDAGGGFLAIQL